MPGKIHIFTGFSASGKSTIEEEFRKSQPGWILLLEDKRCFSVRMLWDIAAKRLFRRETVPSLTNAISDAEHDRLIKDAFRLASQGSNVTVDFAVSPNSLGLLENTRIEAQRQGIDLTLTWVTCSAKTRQKRCKARGTLFDKHLSQRSDYFAAVSELEQKMLARAKVSLGDTLHIEINDEDRVSRRSSSFWAAFPILKTLLGLTHASTPYADSFIKAARFATDAMNPDYERPGAVFTQGSTAFAADTHP